MVARILGSVRSTACPACDGTAGVSRWFDGYDEHELCAHCGISLASRQAGPDVRVLRERHERWLALWRRTA
ncbi:hypothetical protein GCM10010289_06690 [Streptomyces violascens]|uniref:GATA-type domain-containing protein n=1 Tax=Streptomyces violascens TaxID=67381 RepID=A0ABQ3QGD5_9ACTN|nr:hypothetical protein GCM10010289_06690 [Streptomyces violascens]GHI36334.1 hypothetical protein Sviol_07420 [Streptomyces violascens]